MGIGADADLDPGFLGERMGTDRLKANALEANPRRAAQIQIVLRFLNISLLRGPFCLAPYGALRTR